MTNYTKYNRGSEWRKWDLHIHTPETKKHDQFEGSTPEDKWEKYIKAINNSTENIAVIGITDYFCADNYFKFKHFIASGKITKHFDLVLPNIEIRVLPVTGSSTPINLHCIFNPEIEKDIDTRFLSKLKFTYSGSNFSAKKEELIRLGRALPENSSLDENAALKAGIGQYVITMESLRDVFEKDVKLKENAIIAVSNKSADGVSGIRKHSDFFINIVSSQLDATRWSIYQFVDAIFSSNEGDINYFIGRGPDKKEVVLEKCHKLMPCFHGSDAHSNIKIFNPEGNRFCWIKADPTFEGLKQTLYEPEDRVKIQAIKPDVKNERYIISELQFMDTGNLFNNKKILLNENLNAIIGGKSSGKSLLMFSTAKSIDPEQVERTSKRLGFEGYKFETSFDFKVSWKNGDIDILSTIDSSSKLHEITFIPQLYINYLVEKNNKEELNVLVKNILLQDTPFRKFHEDTSKAISDTTTEIERLLNEYLKVRIKGNEVQQKSKDTGNSEIIKNSIKIIEVEILKGQKASNLSEIEFTNYNQLLGEKSQYDAELNNLDLKISILIKILAEIQLSKSNLLGKTEATSQIYLKGQIDRLLDEFGEIPIELKAIKIKLESDFDTLIANFKAEFEKLELNKKRAEILKKLEENSKKLAPFLVKLTGQKELQKLSLQLETEKAKLQSAIALELQLVNLREEYSNIRKQTATFLQRRFELYQQIEKRVNETRKQIGEDIELKCSLIYKLEDFPLFEQSNKAFISNNHFFNTLFEERTVKYENIPKFYENPLRVADDKLFYNKEEFIPLKTKISIEDVLRGLIKDSFDIDYTVTYNGDNLLNMSPGKKGTVLLILFLEISTSEYPILIDQPEDNLDNRTIYDLLCKMIKDKKKERQIIIVSHNANLVVATDTENIIVANQQGQETKLEVGRCRFEYVNGALEHSFAKDEKIKSILLSQGIREHVCDVLEGGGEAFKQRERKYSIKL
jgi:hypothetical protein